MIGIGVGIDYALFIVTRYRAALDRGVSYEAACVESIATAGRAVVFAGCTVMISILGMFIMGIDFLDGLAVGTSLAVAVAVLAAVTLLPALLGLLGGKINRLRLRHHRRDGRIGAWERWARFVQRRPKPVALAGLAVLVVAAVPVFALHLGFADAGNDPKGTTTRTAYDLMAEGFGPGSNGPIVVVADTSTAPKAAGFQHLLDELHHTSGVASVGDPVASPSGAAGAGDGDPDDRAPGPGDRVARAPHPRRPRAAVGHHGGGRGPDGGRHRLRRPHLVPSAAVHRRRARPQLPPADGRVPLDPRAAEGRPHEPAVDRRRLRRDGGRVPVGLAGRRRRRVRRPRSSRGPR